MLPFINVEYLKIKDVAESLGLKDSRPAEKWLQKNNIPISKIGGRRVVYKFSFEFKQQQLLVEELRKCYPSKWFEIYDAKTEDKKMVKAILELYPNDKQLKSKRSLSSNKYIK